MVLHDILAATLRACDGTGKDDSTIGPTALQWMKMAAQKNLSNARSTGGGGVTFEAHVQAAFVVLMLTGGYAPCLPCWPIVELKLQGRVDGFATDDIIVFVENADSAKRRKLLGQIKRSVSITEGCKQFGEALQAAWRDYRNPDVFEVGDDAIALITGPLSATDIRNVEWLLGHAKATATEEFFRNVKRANFGPSERIPKLKAFRAHLTMANEGEAISDEDLHGFLRHFHVLSCDLGDQHGIVLSLLHSHISQFHRARPAWLWARVVDFVMTKNQYAGRIRVVDIPEDVRGEFQQPLPIQIDTELLHALRDHPDTGENTRVDTSARKTPQSWNQHPHATLLAQLVLVGAWRDDNGNDVEAVASLLGMPHDEWLLLGRQVLHDAGSPVTYRDGAWCLLEREELWTALAPRLHDRDIDRLQTLAINILSEVNPALSLLPDERPLAPFLGKTRKYSAAIQTGVSEGLAMMGAEPKSASSCTIGRIDSMCAVVMRSVLSDADWRVWASVDRSLPNLAEAAPSAFLDAVEGCLHLNGGVFRELFAQEGDGWTVGNLALGLLGALETLAWQTDLLVRATVVLAHLASSDPGGRSANRPIESLTTILLPWLPQTIAPFSKQRVAVETILREHPDVGWKLLLRLLPKQHQTSFHSRKARWRNVIPADWKAGVTREEYRLQVELYAELAVKECGQNVGRLQALIERLGELPGSSFEKFSEWLSSEQVVGLPDDQRTLVWDSLMRFVRHQRRFSDAEWAVAEHLVNTVERVASGLAPTDPFFRHLHLFSGRGHELYEERGNWQQQHAQLERRREEAVAEVLDRHGLDGVVRFADAVLSPDQVGRALAASDGPGLAHFLLPAFLCSASSSHRALVGSFVSRRFGLNGVAWCNELDRSTWTKDQTGQFLAFLPFARPTWDTVNDWLGIDEHYYWSRTQVRAFQADGDLDVAVEKLLLHARPRAALDCLGGVLQTKLPLNRQLTVRALLEAVGSSEPLNPLDTYQVSELICALQADPSTPDEECIAVECAYLPLLTNGGPGSPRRVHGKLAGDPSFFCEAIRLVYRSDRDAETAGELSERKRTMARNVLLLLRTWTRPPGRRDDGGFDAVHFVDWLSCVRSRAASTGHLDVALVHAGRVLIHVPPDVDGLWIDRTVAGALNSLDSGTLRRAFSTALYNARGAHFIDFSGSEERELSMQINQKAEAVEDAGYHRFAAVLRELAGSYVKEAEWVAQRHVHE